MITPAKGTSETKQTLDDHLPQVAEVRARYAALTEQALHLANEAAVRFSAARAPLSEATREGRAAFVALKLAQDDSTGIETVRQAENAISLYAEKLRSARSVIEDIRRLLSYQMELRDVQDDLIRAGSGRRHRVLGLARRIRSDVLQNAQQPPGVFLLREEGPEQERRDWLFSSLNVARLLSWTASLYQPLAASAELLSSAALLNDVGLAFWQEVRGVSPWELLRRRPEDFRAHPQLSAALVGGIPDAPAALPRLVGLHHECLDGGGYPHRLRRWSLPPLARVLQVAVRFTELRLAPGNAPSNDPGKAGSAVRQLIDETERGRWDAACVNLLLPAIGFGQNSERYSAPPMPLSEFGRRLLRVDALHETLPGPHAKSRAATEIPRPHFLQERSLRPEAVPISAARSWD